LGVKNFSVLVSHVTVPPAMLALLSAPDNRVQAFLAAGHVCTVMGFTEYEPIAATYHVPIIVTGFEPVDLLEGMLMAVKQLEAGDARVENQYVRAVRRDGNVPARSLVEQVFELADRKWRGIGEIPLSGLALREEFLDYDAVTKFGLEGITATEPAECRAGDVLRGQLKPMDCPAFGKICTPDRPLGAPMVSSEGACAAYFNYGRFRAGAMEVTV
jgi:hydrogenase expression/formation protein HypD